ncbi:hypothetical protein D9M71_483440 [compost metagenome]
MISWVTTSNIAPAASANPKGSSSSARLTSQAHTSANTGSTNPDAAPIRNALTRDIPAPASTKAMTNPSGTSCKAMPMARLSASGMPPPAETPTAMPSGMLWAMMANTNSQMRGAMTGRSRVPTRLSGLTPETFRSTRNNPNAPSIMPKLISPLDAQGDSPSPSAAEMPGTISENAVAASITPAPKPSKVSLSICGIRRITNTGTAPSAVPKAQIAPPCSARSNFGSRSSHASPWATKRLIPASSNSDPNA